ncbi:MAG: hypothetical protein EU536_00635 [Promethearchaeota archaeon]|nr:MAG: hypothetical protein EU536_00635 [Candidatus Lokiarchaeota archaeon]
MQYQDISISIFIVLSIYLGFLTCYLILKATRTTDERKYYFLSIAIFSALYLLCRILLIYNSIAEEAAYNSIYILGSFFAVLGVAGLMLAVEKYVYQKLKFFPTILVIIFSALILLYPQAEGILLWPPYEGTNLVTYWVAFGTISAIIIPLLYLKVAANSHGIVRKNSIYIAFGILIFLVGNAMNTKLITDLVPLLLIFAPITMLFGLLLFNFGLR